MKFLLFAIELQVLLGVTEDERSRPQKVMASLEWEFSPTKAVKSDDINDTIDYFTIRKTIEHFTLDKEWCLLEKMHSDLLSELKNKFPRMQNAQLKLTKFPFPHGGVMVEN